MAGIESTVPIGSDSFRANRDGMLALIERVNMLRRRTEARSSASTRPTPTAACRAAASSPASASSAARAAW